MTSFIWLDEDERNHDRSEWTFWFKGKLWDASSASDEELLYCECCFRSSGLSSIFQLTLSISTIVLYSSESVLPSRIFAQSLWSSA